MSGLTCTHKIVATVIGLGLFILVLYYIRSRKLDAAFSIWWILTSVFILLIAWCDRFLMYVALRFGFSEIRSLVLTIGILFSIVSCLHISVFITVLARQIKDIGQELTLKHVVKADVSEARECADENNQAV
jgi:hypothetical protein